jgi:Tfp pilus assembly protein PilP
MKAFLPSTALRRPTAVAALALSALAITACGESSQEKASAQVCDARADISKEVNTLTGLTITTASVTQVKTGVEAIVGDLKKIKDAQPNLAPARKEQVQSANDTFETEVTKIVSGLASNLSLSNAEAQLKSAVSQLAASYKKTLAPINCS